MKSFIGTFCTLLKVSAIAWSKDNVSRLGAALAFYSVLSLGPLLLLVLVAATNIWGEQAAEGQIVGQITHIVGNDGAKFVQDVLNVSSHTERSGLIATLLGFGTLLISASAVFNELQGAFDIIWKVPPSGRRPWVTLLRERLFSVLLVLCSGLLLIASLVVSATTTAVLDFVGQNMPWLHIVMPLIDIGVSFGVITLVFGMAFKIVPSAHVAWRNVWPGAMLTAILFIVGKILIGLYLARTSVASSYGAAGSLIVLLLWIYYTAQIVYFGAEFSHTYAAQNKRTKKKISSPA